MYSRHHFFVTGRRQRGTLAPAMTPDKHLTMQARSSAHYYFSGTLSWLYRAFDSVATWVTQLSWWKFFLFAALMLIAGTILQEELFSGSDEEPRLERGERKERASITIDDSGIRFYSRNKNPPAAPGARPSAR